MIGVIGEILIDMIGEEKNGIQVYSRYAGGAPFNLACAAKKLGADVLFHGVVGKDAMGSFLLSFVEKQGLDSSYISVSEDLNTTLALVSHDEKGERSFSFYRKNTADDAFSNDIPEALKKAHILHFGTLMLSSFRGRDFVKEQALSAKARGQIVTMDVNYREDVFASKEEAMEIFKSFLPLANVLKFSDEEVPLFGDEYVSSFPDKIVLVTLGKEGSKLLYRGKEYRASSISVHPMDTTGAGDSFFGAFLSRIDGKDFASLSEREIVDILRFSNVVAALSTEGNGAIDGLPTLETVEKRMEEAK
ncbi:MAG: carbohydrate kinase [Candidatus Enteromonas sp.]